MRGSEGRLWKPDGRIRIGSAIEGFWSSPAPEYDIAPAPSRRSVEPGELMEDLPDIESVTTIFAGHFDLTAEETARAVEYVKEQLVQDDCAILRYEGHASLKAFVITVIHRLVGQYRAEQCAAWPGADASSPSAGAETIRHLMVHYGFSWREAAALYRVGAEGEATADAADADDDSRRIRMIVTAFIASLSAIDRLLFEAIIFKSETFTETSRTMRVKARYVRVRVERLVRRLQARLREE